MDFWRKIWQMVIELLLPNRESAKEIANLSAEVFRNQVGEVPPTSLSDIVLFPYRQPLAKAVIWELKYHRNQDAVKIVAELLTEAIYAYLEETWPLGISDQDIILIPIPLSEKREQERGFNQVALVLDAIAQSDFAVLKSKLIRTRHTPRQTTLSNKAERQQNIVDSFAITDKSPVAGKVIFLTDDVVTTGSTLAEAKKVLLEAGAHQVITVAFAH